MPTPKTEMTESEFWMYLARCIGHGETIPNSRYHWGRKRPYDGLCHIVRESLTWRGSIVVPPHSQAPFDRLDKYRQDNHLPLSSHWFPLNATGDRRRMMVCLQLAREAEKEEQVIDLEGTYRT